MADIIDDPIKLGAMLFTMVEPHKGHEVAYNRWYERDHFYGGCMVGPFHFAGNRFVSTRDLKEQRYPVESPITPDPMTGSYTAVYWVLDGHHEEWNKWAVDQVTMLHQTGRMFPHRDHIHTVVYKYIDAVSRDEDSVPPELALDHPYKGFAVSILEATGDREEAIAWVKAQLPEWIKGSGAGQALIFTPIPLLDSAPADVPRDPATAVRVMVLWFLDEDPIKALEPFQSLGKLVDEGGLAKLVWQSSSKTTITGTDTYTDQLW